MKNLTRNQQLIYHLLRYFAKKELIHEDWRNEEEILSTYSLKTLMLWQCEQKSSEWWDSKEILELCCDLLKILLDWLLNLDCKNYFIKECNLFAHKMNEANYRLTGDKLSLYTNESKLRQWFHDEYIRKFVDNQYDNEELIISEIWFTSPDLSDSLYRFVLTSYCVTIMRKAPYTTYVGKDFESFDLTPPLFTLIRERCLRHIGLIDGVFVDFYKAHVMLQVATTNRTWHKADFLLAMLCSLFLKQSPFWKESSKRKPYVDVFQMIERDRFYILALNVLNGYTTNCETDHHLQIKLAKILIKKELKLSGDYLNKSNRYDVNRELLHLGALYFASKRYETCMKHVALTSDLHQRTDFWGLLDVRYLLFIDEMAFAVGLLQLLGRFDLFNLDSMSLNENFATSLTFFSNWLSCLSLIRKRSLTTRYSHRVMKPFTPVTQTEFCLYRIMQKQISFSYGANICKRSEYKPLSHNDADGIFQVSEKDKFHDLLTKCAVIHLTKFYRSLREDEDFKNRKCVKAMSHYKALYSFKQGRYDTTLKLCNDILMEEKSSEDLNCDCFDPFCSCMKPTHCFPFQELFDSDFICLVGLTRLINISFYYPDASEIHNLIYDRDYTLSDIRPNFIAKYLTVQSILKYKNDKRELLDALRQLMPCTYFIERVVTKFLARLIEKTLTH